MSQVLHNKLRSFTELALAIYLQMGRWKFPKRQVLAVVYFDKRVKGWRARVRRKGWQRVAKTFRTRVQRNATF